MEKQKCETFSEGLLPTALRERLNKRPFFPCRIRGFYLAPLLVRADTDGGLFKRSKYE